jgi:hypothetical protein
MYPCRGLEAAMILYYYNLVVGRKAWVLQEHLSRCHRCKEYLENLERVSRMARKGQAHSGLSGKETILSHAEKMMHY